MCINMSFTYVNIYILNLGKSGSRWINISLFLFSFVPFVYGLTLLISTLVTPQLKCDSNLFLYLIIQGSSLILLGLTTYVFVLHSLYYLFIIGDSQGVGPAENVMYLFDSCCLSTFSNLRAIFLLAAFIFNTVIFAFGNYAIFDSSLCKTVDPLRYWFGFSYIIFGWTVLGIFLIIGTFIVYKIFFDSDSLLDAFMGGDMSGANYA
jgi:hypothetical protein